MSSETKHGLLPATMATGHANIRREPRFEMRFEIEVCGFGPDSQPFRIRTVTLDVSEWGCRFEAPFSMEANSVFTVQALADDRGQPAHCEPVMFQVVRARKSENQWEVAAWKVAAEKAWPVDLPAATPAAGDEQAAIMRRDGTEH